MQNLKILSMILLSAVLFLESCNQDEVKETAIETSEVNGINFTGATFNGRITSVNSSGLREAGFIYGEFSDLTDDNSTRVTVVGVNGAGAIYFASTDYFAIGETYFVKAYAISNDGKTVFGKNVQFVGKGGTGFPPIINDFTPKEGRIGTTITITGKYFDKDVTHVRVTLGNTNNELEVVQSTTTQIVIKVPYDFPVTENTTSLIVKIRDKSVGTSNFRLINPWKKLNDFPGNARYGAVGFNIGTTGFVGLGRRQGGGNLYTGDFWSYDIASDSWQSIASYGTDGYYMNQSAFVISNIAYVGIGTVTNFNDIRATNSSFLKYDPLTNLWTAGIWIAENGYFASSNSVVNGKGYVITGNLSNNKNLQFDPSGSWTEKLSFPGALRYNAATFTIGDKIYISSGAGAAVGSVYKDMWMYDASTNLWTQKTTFRGAGRWYASAFATNGLGFVVGGLTTDSEYLDDVWMYNPATDKWTQLNDFPGGPTIGAAVFSVNSKIYLVAGAKSDGIYKREVWEFSL